MPFSYRKLTAFPNSTLCPVEYLLMLHPDSQASRVFLLLLPQQQQVSDSGQEPFISSTQIHLLLNPFLLFSYHGIPQCKHPPMFHSLIYNQRQQSGLGAATEDFPSWSIYLEEKKSNISGDHHFLGRYKDGSKILSSSIGGEGRRLEDLDFKTTLACVRRLT